MSDARDTLDREQRGAVDILRARLSRYETAMRAALDCTTRYFGDDFSNRKIAECFENMLADARAILRAALSDQPAEDCNHLTLIGGAPYCCTLQKGHAQGHTYEKAPAAPAEEPAESKLEAIRRLAATLNLNPDLHSAALTDVGKENRKISEAILAILEAQPSTPSGEEGKRV